MGPDGMMGGMWGFMLLWFLLGVAVLVALVAGVVWLVRRAQQPPPGERGPSAVEELERRYARGEIDREEYLERRVYLGDAQEERQQR